MNLMNVIYDHYQRLVDTTAPALMYEALRAELTTGRPELSTEQIDEAIKAAMNMIAQNCRNIQCQMNTLDMSVVSYTSTNSSQSMEDFISLPSRTMA